MPVLILMMIVVLTLLVNRVATVALTLTGMSREMARFQARSALSTAGFTTQESESVVNHPVRRRIIFLLMLVGSAGFVGVIATTVASLTHSEGDKFAMGTKLGLISAGLAGIWALAMSKWLDDAMFRWIAWALKRWTTLDVQDFRDLLQLGEGYSVTEITVEPGDWIVGKPLLELRLSDGGVNVLGIHRKDGDFVGAPIGETYIRAGDKLIVYGSRDDLIDLDEGKSESTGFERHQERVLERRAQRLEDAGDERSDEDGETKDEPNIRRY